MKKLNIVKKNQDFDRIIKNTNPFKTREFLIFIERKNVENYQFGISISKKIGNAVTRNKLKRQIKNIIDKKHYENNFNCIIIVRKEILNANFTDMEKSLSFAFQKLKITKES